jgi:hypothetical protein
VELLDHEMRVSQVAPPVWAPGAKEDELLAARRSLRAQIAKLERELADAFVTAYPMGGLGRHPVDSHRDPRLLGLGELEQVRDQLAERLHEARASITERADMQERNRLLLERMLLEPGKHRFVRVACQDLGEPGCGVWHVRPRLGLIGMLMGWWQVKLSSGCPLAGGRGLVPRPGSASSKNLYMRDAVRMGAGAILVLMIMVVGSFVLWIGAPLLWLWLGSQIEASTSSVGTAIGAAFLGAVLTIVLVAAILAKLSNSYRANRVARGLDDPGHFVLEVVLVVSAAVALFAFLIWFFFLAGAEPLPVGIKY